MADGDEGYEVAQKQIFEALEEAKMLGVLDVLWKSDKITSWSFPEK